MQPPGRAAIAASRSVLSRCQLRPVNSSAEKIRQHPPSDRNARSSFILKGNAVFGAFLLVSKGEVQRFTRWGKRSYAPILLRMRNLLFFANEPFYAFRNVRPDRNNYQISCSVQVTFAAYKQTTNIGARSVLFRFVTPSFVFGRRGLT